MTTGGKGVALEGSGGEGGRACEGKGMRMVRRRMGMDLGIRVRLRQNAFKKQDTSMFI
jgi:hypothetical protein